MFPASTQNFFKNHFFEVGLLTNTTLRARLSKSRLLSPILEIVFTRAALAFDNLFMGCVFNINTVHKTVEKLTFQAFY